MKRALFILALLFAAWVVCALPPGTPVSISGSHIWTNNSNYIWPAGEPGPDSNGVLPGPSMFIRNDGSIFGGTNVSADWPLANYSRTFPFNYVTQMDSNEVNILDGHIAVFDSEANQNFVSIYDISVKGDKDNGQIIHSIQSGITNGATAEIDEATFPNSPSSTVIQIITNGATVFKADGNGIVRARQYVVLGTTNQVVFGATNTPPAGSASTPSKWISVQVSGETVVYRLPLYQ